MAEEQTSTTPTLRWVDIPESKRGNFGSDMGGLTKLPVITKDMIRYVPGKEVAPDAFMGDNGDAKGWQPGYYEFTPEARALLDASGVKWSGQENNIEWFLGIPEEDAATYSSFLQTSDGSPLPTGINPSLKVKTGDRMSMNVSYKWDEEQQALVPDVESAFDQYFNTRDLSWGDVGKGVAFVGSVMAAGYAAGELAPMLMSEFGAAAAPAVLEEAVAAGVIAPEIATATAADIAAMADVGMGAAGAAEGAATAAEIASIAAPAAEAVAPAAADIAAMADVGMGAAGTGAEIASTVAPEAIGAADGLANAGVASQAIAPTAAPTAAQAVAPAATSAATGATSAVPAAAKAGGDALLTGALGADGVALTESALAGATGGAAGPSLQSALTAGLGAEGAALTNSALTGATIASGTSILDSVISGAQTVWKALDTPLGRTALSGAFKLIGGLISDYQAKEAYDDYLKRRDNAQNVGNVTVPASLTNRAKAAKGGAMSTMVRVPEFDAYKVGRP